MRISLTSIFVLAGCFFLTGCGEVSTPDVSSEVLAVVPAGYTKSNLPEPSGGITLSIESMPITADEVIEPISDRLAVLAKNSSYPEFQERSQKLLGQVIVRKIADVKLYLNAKAALPENVNDEVINNIVDQEIEKFIASHGGNYAKAEETLNKMGLSWNEFREHQKRAMLVQSFVSEEVKEDRPITHSELLDYYQQVKSDYSTEDVVEFSLIDIEASRFVDANTNAVAAMAKASAKAEDIIEEIVGGADFADMAKKYSHGERASVGGKWKPVRPGSLAEPYDIVENTAMNMAVGEVKGPIVAAGHAFIIKLQRVEKAGQSSFDDIQGEIEARLLFTRREKMVNNMMTELMQTVNMDYAEDFMNYCMYQAYVKLR